MAFHVLNAWEEKAEADGRVGDTATCDTTVVKVVTCDVFEFNIDFVEAVKDMTPGKRFKGGHGMTWWRVARWHGFGFDVALKERDGTPTLSLRNVPQTDAACRCTVYFALGSVLNCKGRSPFYVPPVLFCFCAPVGLFFPPRLLSGIGPCCCSTTPSPNCIS